MSELRKQATKKIKKELNRRLTGAQSKKNVIIYILYYELTQSEGVNCTYLSWKG
jgi:hypothetical protein